MTALSSTLARHLLGEATGVEATVAGEVRFASPYADYADRERIVHLFTVMPAVFEDARAEREIVVDGEIVTIFTARVGEQQLTAVLDERLDAHGRTHDAMLLIRPLAATRAAIARMSELLETDPRLADS